MPSSSRYIIIFVIVISSLIAFSFYGSSPTSTIDTVPPTDEITRIPETTATDKSSSLTQSNSKDDDDPNLLIIVNKDLPKDGHHRPHSTSAAASSTILQYVPTSPVGESRGVIALYLTHVGFHGVGLVRANIHGWVQNLMLPQKNLDLVLFYDTTNVTEEVLVSRIGLTPVADLEEKIRKASSSSSDAATMSQRTANDEVLFTAMMNHNIVRPLILRNRNISSTSSSTNKTTAFRMIPASLSQLTSSGQRWFTFCSPSNSIKNCVLLSLIGVGKKWPKYLQNEEKRNNLLARKDWLRCGCPPYCPVRRNPPEYVQGTRWYTYDIFFEADGWISKYYDYWAKLDVDIGIFRPIVGVNLLDEMRSKNKIFLHTGYTYNGGGCSNNLHKSITTWCSEKAAIAPVSALERWWQQDDNVYYSNFVISSVRFHTAQKPLELARFLNDDVEEGFFKYRWTDQSLFHKVFGVFVGPKEEDFLLDFSWMRWTKKVYRKNAVFYHSKKGKSRGELGKYTKL